MNNESGCFTGISKHEIHCFRVFGYPGETRARVVYIIYGFSNESRRNRMFSFADLNIIIFMHSMHNVIRNSM